MYNQYRILFFLLGLFQSPKRFNIEVKLIGINNDLDIKLKISDQECHMFSNTPHWSKPLPSLLRYWAIHTVISTIGKICVILMHHRGP